MHDAPLWRPSHERVDGARITSFRRAVSGRYGVDLDDSHALWQFSVDRPAEFWESIWDFCGVMAECRGGRTIADPQRMPGARFFPDARLNFAENLLRGDPAREAVVFWGEDRVRRRLTLGELRRDVARCASALRGFGVGRGDRVAAYLPNVPEAVVAMLATASIGAVWSSCSPDFGAPGVLDRFGQIAPTVLFAADGYLYGGKAYDCLGKLAAIREGLPGVRATILVSYAGGEREDGAGRGLISWERALDSQPESLAFEPLPFDHPLFVLYSSGTTGVPKCIVHGAGGTLLQHLKEHQLHCDIRRGDRVFYFTTCGWMMWNWLVSALASEATLLLYDGSPFHPDGTVLFDLADAEGMTLFGTSAKYLAAVEKAGLSPIDSHRLDTVRTMTSTGSPLSPDGFDFVYRRIKQDLHLASISGGTDIVSCFVCGDPAGPVYPGEIQMAGLGMKVDVWDAGGHPVREQKGELVCTAPFPSMPLGFWSDPDGGKYRAAYFGHFPGAWRHGDFAEISRHGGFVIHGRSDAVLNPGGVRIGTAEIYRQVEQCPEVVEALVVGQQWEGDERVVLFVRLRDGLALDGALEERIRRRIRENTSPRHVPAKVVQVSDIPRTRSGKIVELAVRDVIHGRNVANREALSNPEALDLFRDLAALNS